MTWSDFKRHYSMYPLSRVVRPGTMLSEESLFASLIDKSIFNSEKIEILNYYNTEEDEYGIIANGVFLNPVLSKQRKSRVSPLPWNHKELPFAKTIYRPTSPPLFWGASLMHLAKDEIDAYNEIIEMSLDRIYKAINPPIITTDYSVPQGLKLKSGELYTARGEFKEIKMDPLDPSVWNVGALLQNQIERTSTPAISPSAPTRQPKSAMENLLRQQRELQSHQLQKLFFQDLLEQKVWLLIQNAIQFLTTESIKKKLGKVFEKTLFIDDIQTPVGISSLEIRVKQSPQLKSPQELRGESILKSLANKKRVEIIEISIEALRDLKFDIGIKFDLENTPELKKALFMEFVKTIMSLFPSQIDPNKLLIRLFEIYNENPADYLPTQAILSMYGKKSLVSGNQLPQPSQPNQMGENNTTKDNLIQTQRGAQTGGLNTQTPSGNVSLNDLILAENG